MMQKAKIQIKIQKQIQKIQRPKMYKDDEANRWELLQINII